MAATCGTVAGYMAHYRRHEPACDPCLKAKSTYSNAHDGDTRRAYMRARGRALQRIADRYRAEFLAVFAEERQKEAGRQAREAGS